MIQVNADCVPEPGKEFDQICFEIIIQTSNEYLKQFTHISLRERSYSNNLTRNNL